MFSEEVQDAAANVTLKEYYDRVTAAKGETEKEQARTALGNVLRNSIMQVGFKELRSQKRSQPG